MQAQGSSRMRMMQAAYLTGHGGNDVVTFGERPMPVRFVIDPR